MYVCTPDLEAVRKKLSVSSLNFLCINFAFDEVPHLQIHLLILKKAGSTEESVQCSPATLGSNWMILLSDTQSQKGTFLGSPQ